MKTPDENIKMFENIGVSKEDAIKLAEVCKDEPDVKYGKISDLKKYGIILEVTK